MQAFFTKIFNFIFIPHLQIMMEFTLALEFTFSSGQLKIL